MTEENSSKRSKDHNTPEKQRALVLQGGGALGAYEVGVLKVLCKKLLESGGNDTENGPLFDIIAGSSMGAMNAAVLVSNVVNRHKSWKEAVGVLEDFWMDEKNGLSSTPDINKWLDDAKKQKNFNASSEAARRYYSVKYYLAKGTPNVCFKDPEPERDVKFGDRDNNNNPVQWTWYISDPLQHTIERYSKDENTEKLKIATSWEHRQPRLLVISVDVSDGKTITFDSYHTKDDLEKGVYEGDGITIDHIMASGTIPLFYKFRVIDGRSFYDGGFLNNTPFRELLQAHRDYWTKVADNVKAKIPDLDVYIVNVHPSKRNIIPNDHDGVNDRFNDITYSDRNSGYDEMVTDIVTDYNDLEETLLGAIQLIHKLTNTNEGMVFQNGFEQFLTIAEEKSKTREVRREKYKDLIKGKFTLKQVIRIERASDVDAITGKEADYSSKATDFTHDSIKMLIEQGEKDALKILEGC